MNIQNDIKKENLDRIVKRILSVSDAVYVSEIYLTEGSVNDNGFLKNDIKVMICTKENFVNHDLYDLMNDIDEEEYPFSLILSIEPDAVERGYGITLWKEE